MSELPAKRPPATPAGVSRDTAASLFGAFERSGDWEVADVIRAVARLGEVTLDFRQARLPSDGIVEVQCDVLMGQVELIVPPEAEIRMDGVRCVFGDVRQRGQRPRMRSLVRQLLAGEPEDESTHTEEPPLFVVTGRAWFGSIYVTIR